MPGSTIGPRRGPNRYTPRSERIPASPEEAHKTQRSRPTPEAQNGREREVGDGPADNLECPDTRRGINTQCYTEQKGMDGLTSGKRVSLNAHQGKVCGAANVDLTRCYD